MPKKIYVGIVVIVTLWTFISISILALNFIGMLPYYDIRYIEKTGITPEMSLFPGQQIRLNALFSRSVSKQNIEKITWNIQDSHGKEFKDIPNLSSIDLIIPPDLSGMLNINVAAKVNKRRRAANW